MGPFLKMDKEWTQTYGPEEKKVDDKCTMLYTDRLYVSRKEGGRGFSSMKDSVDVSIQGLKDYIKKSKEGLITAASNSNDNIRTNKTTITRKQAREEK